MDHHLPHPETRWATRTDDCPLPAPGGPFGVGKFFVAAVVAALFDQLLGLIEGVAVAKEARTDELNVGHVQPHRTTLGDLPRLVQILARTQLVALDPTHPRPDAKNQGSSANCPTRLAAMTVVAVCAAGPSQAWVQVYFRALCVGGSTVKTADAV